MFQRVTLVRTDVSEERRFLQELHGVTSQKMAFFNRNVNFPRSTATRVVFPSETVCFLLESHRNRLWRLPSRRRIIWEKTTGEWRKPLPSTSKWTYPTSAPHMATWRGTQKLLYWQYFWEYVPPSLCLQICKVLLTVLFFIYVMDWSGTEATVTAALIGLLYQPWMIDGDCSGVISGMNEGQGKPKYSEQSCHSAALSTWLDRCG
jgi:hypothetical protein